MNLTDNTILITGGNGGIGRGLAEAFHKLGNTVIITGRKQDKLNETVAANSGMRAMTLDVADPADVKRFADKVAEEFPALNVLVNNAGISIPEDVTDGDTTDAEVMVATNVLGPIRLTAALLPTMMNNAGATVMNVSSGLAFLPIFPFPTYCATKAAVHSYSQSLRRQLEGKGVQVMELIPPYVQTHLGGEAQANDPDAMPLDEFISESMEILKANPSAHEINVERVKMLRNAERENRYDETFEKYNKFAAKRAAAARKGE